MFILVLSQFLMFNDVNTKLANPVTSLINVPLLSPFEVFSAY